MICRNSSDNARVAIRAFGSVHSLRASAKCIRCASARIGCGRGDSPMEAYTPSPPLPPLHMRSKRGQGGCRVGKGGGGGGCRPLSPPHPFPQRVIRAASPTVVTVYVHFIGCRRRRAQSPLYTRDDFSPLMGVGEGGGGQIFVTGLAVPTAIVQPLLPCLPLQGHCSLCSCSRLQTYPLRSFHSRFRSLRLIFRQPAFLAGPSP